MLVELTTSLASRRKSHRAGEIVDLPEKEARKRIASGEAIPVRSRPVETTSRRTPMRRTVRAT